MSRRSTQELLDELGRLDPIAGSDLDPGPIQQPGRRQPVPGRFRVLVGSTLIFAIAVSTALAILPLGAGEEGPGGVIAAAAAVAAEQAPRAPGPGEFAYRSELWWQQSLPGEIDEATPSELSVSGAASDPPPREGSREVWFAADGKGDVEGRRSGRWPGCSAGDLVLAISTYQDCWSQIGGPAGEVYELSEIPPTARRHIERRLKRRGQPVPRFTEFSGIEALVEDPSRIDAAVDDLAARERQRDLWQTANNEDWIAWGGGKPASEAAKLRAVADLLANPLATPELRGALFTYAGALEGVESTPDATDPLGREGAALSIVEGARDPAPILISGLGSVLREPLGRFEDEGYVLDLSELSYRTELIFDPESSELLAERVVLTNAADPLLGGWLEREGAPETVSYRTFEPTATVDELGERP